jgi:hypothetical protein
VRAGMLVAAETERVGRYFEMGVAGSAVFPKKSILPFVNPPIGPRYGFFSFEIAGQSKYGVRCAKWRLRRSGTLTGSI